MEDRQKRREQRLKRKQMRKRICLGMAVIIPMVSLIMFGAVYSAGEQIKEPNSSETLEKEQEAAKGKEGGKKQETKRRIDQNRPMVAITYDDGPGFEAEDRILDSLEQNDAVATFFYLGCRIEGNEDKIKRAYDMGCEMGNHTWNHPVLTELTERGSSNQFKRTNEAIRAVCGETPTVFRPSYGKTNDAVNAASDLPVILWSIDTMDWHDRDGQRIFERITREGDLDGKIILMHSIYDSTADATELLLPWLKEQGYQTVTVSELIRYRDGSEPQKGVVYR